jgi:tRNA nucleotidyltransferase (CCA-adding enzyme)
MAYNPTDGLTDIFGGVTDARNGIIRAVGDPKVRFDEDALRILRGLRFAATLGFEIEDDTALAIREKAPLLLGVSGERIYQELKKLIMGKSASKILREFAEVISLCLGGVSVEKYPEDNMLQDSDLVSRLALLFLLNSDSPTEAADRAFDILRADNSTRRDTKDTILAYGDVCFDTRRDILRSLAKYGRLPVEYALGVGLATGHFTEDDDAFYCDFMDSQPIYTVAGLKVDGNDIAALGYRGREIGDRLKLLLNSYIDGKVKNDKEQLIAYLKSNQ